MPAKGPLGSSGRVGGGGSAAGARGGRVTSASKPSARSGMAARRVARAKKEYEMLRKNVIKTAREQKDIDIIRALNKRGGTKPYSKMEFGAMSKSKVNKPSKGTMAKPNPKPRKGNQR